MGAAEETFLHRLFPSVGDDGEEKEKAKEKEKECDEEEERESLAAQVQRAPHARGAELRRLLRSRAERVLLALLTNPELGVGGALAIAQSARASAGVLAELSRDRELSSDPQVARALCMNQRTPYFASRSLLSRLAPAVLREIGTSSGVPAALAKEALDAAAEKRTRRQQRGG